MIQASSPAAPSPARPSDSEASASEAIDSAKDRLRDHPLYARIRSPDAMRIFMEHHVLCVWDFMTLLKSLQRDLTSLGLAWTPPADPEAARLINEIVVDEESDRVPALAGHEAEFGSHFEWYLAAMREAGCDTGPIERFLRALGDASRPGAAEHPSVTADIARVSDDLSAAGFPAEATRFTRTTLGFLSQPLHVRAAVFFHGREDVIPRMFLSIVRELADERASFGLLVAYLERHIEVDSGLHGPLAANLLQRLFAGDDARRAEAETHSLLALEARERLWDGILARVQSLDPAARSTPQGPSACRKRRTRS